MYNIPWVQKLYTLDDLIDNCVDKFGVESVLKPFDEVEQIAFEVLENEINLSFLLEGLL